MLGLVPKGLGRILPLTSYTCVRCGKVNRRLSGILAAYSPQMLLTPLLIIVMVVTVWFLLFAPQTPQGNSVRQEIVTVVEQPASQVPQDAPTESLPRHDTPANSAFQAAPDGQSTPGTTPQPLPDETQGTPQNDGVEQPRTAIPVSAERPTTQDETDSLPSPGASPSPQAEGQDPAAASEAQAQKTPTPAPPSRGKSALEEVVVPAPPKAKRPTVVASAKKGKDSGWSNATLLGLHSGIWNDALVLSLDVKGLAGEPTGFQLSSPPRYVVDVPGNWTYAGEKQISVAKGSVSTVRLGIHQDKLRIVLDLDHEPKQASARRTPDGLTITIR